MWALISERENWLMKGGANEHRVINKARKEGQTPRLSSK